MRYLIAILFCFSFSIKAQNYHNIWFFGNNSGLNFNYTSPLAYFGGHMESIEGSSVICDENGQVLFYSNGTQIWNKQFYPMRNSENILGDRSSSQSSLIVPQPGHKNKYYLFTTDAIAGVNGCRYSIIDTDRDFGRGAVTRKNILLVSQTPEKITASYHENGEDIWIITHGWNNNKFYAFLLTAEGIKTPVISESGSKHQAFKSLVQAPNQEIDIEYYRTAIGYMKVSPNGKHLALAVSSGDRYVELFKFNSATGELSKPIKIDHLGTARKGEYGGTWDVSAPYGIEFSPNSKYLYVGLRSFEQLDDASHIYQLQLDPYIESEVVSSIEVIGNDKQVGALLLGPDNRIYVAKKGSRFLGLIQSPNEKGEKSLYEEKGIRLSNSSSSLGLPNNFHISNKKLSLKTFDTNLYPNPSNGVSLSVAFNESHSELQLVVYNLHGIEVFRSNTPKLINTFSLVDLDAGIYPYNIYFKGDIITSDRIVILR